MESENTNSENNVTTKTNKTTKKFSFLVEEEDLSQEKDNKLSNLILSSKKVTLKDYIWEFLFEILVFAAIGVVIWLLIHYL